MNFSGDPEMRDNLKEKIDDKICRMANKKESYCCKVTEISQTDLSAKFSKSLNNSCGRVVRDFKRAAKTWCNF